MANLRSIRGAALLTVILVVGTAGMVGFLALAHSSISRVLNAQETIMASEVRLKTFGCLDEILINLKSDPAYVIPASLTTSTAICTVSSSVPAPGQLNIDIHYNSGSLYFGLHAQVDTATTDILELYPTLD